MALTLAVTLTDVKTAAKKPGTVARLMDGHLWCADTLNVLLRYCVAANTCIKVGKGSMFIILAIIAFSFRSGYTVGMYSTCSEVRYLSISSKPPSHVDVIKT